ncbi:hypothetical protein KUCAC02_035466 [Chaenocephalus aceratus]|nr:hypothetical protein KUCAC02_035466 [Chaenocephalus aceratus]
MIHQEQQSSGLTSRLTTLQEDVGKSPARKRSASVTNLSLDRSGSSAVQAYDSSVSPPSSRALSGTKSGSKLDHNEEERKILLDSSQLKDLWKKICHNNTGMEFQDHRYWLRTYPNCIVGKELVNWLLRNGTISTRAQAIAIGQALVDGRWLDCVTQNDQLFRDEYALYRPLQSTDFSETPSPDSDSVNSVEGHSEPSWFKDIKFDDSDTEQLADEARGQEATHSWQRPGHMPNSASPSKRTSVSSSQSAVDSDSASSINLNMEQNNVNFHIKKQAKYPCASCLRAESPLFFQAEYLLSEDGGQNIVISDAFIKESLFNRRVEEKAKEILFTPLGWHHSSLDQLREENGEKKAMERLLSANHSHMMALLQQLLYSESLSLSWRDIIVPVVRQVVQTVRPDVRNCDDDMDIRQLVHIKKNIAHKKMNPYIKNPKILLLKCSIEYLYREESKFSCIDPIVLQEREFLKNYVQRIVDVRPTLVLVEKTVSRIAQDMLLEHGITLVINVKPQVLDRVSRMTQGDLVMSMDQLLTKPRLGTCLKFYMQPFILANSKKLSPNLKDYCYEPKTLMFFEGCPHHLGCSIKLRGASEYELARVKEIIMLMVCVAYHSQLETLSSWTSSPCRPASLKAPRSPASSRAHEEGCNAETMTSSPLSSHVLPIIPFSLPFLIDEDPEMSSDTLIMQSEGETMGETSLMKGDSQDMEDTDSLETTTTPRLFRDPLQDDTGMFVAEQVASTDDRLKSISAVFKQELKDIILCISPFITFKEPFLLMSAGMHCPSRDYFPEQVFLSPLLDKDFKELDGRRKRQLLKDSAPSSLLNGQMNGAPPMKPVDVLPPHSLTSTCIIEQLSGSHDLAKMLADYRAKGGRIRQREAPDPFSSSSLVAPVSASTGGRTLLKTDSEDEKTGKLNDLDCLNPVNHQRLCVLFSSSSAQSNNAPNPCVSPWIVTMEFYGKNDLSLGVFLERYCFSAPACTVRLHGEPIRRFVHGSGCVQIVLKELDSPVPGYQHTILNYSWCRVCKQVTPVVPLSNDSWSMSFAKYLELRFYGHQYTRRANVEPCGHSIHKDYHQYFSYNQMVASFSYTSVRLLEICLPRPKIFIRNLGPSKANMQQDLKDFSLKVTQVYLAIDDRLTSLKTDTFSKTREEKMRTFSLRKT